MLSTLIDNLGSEDVALTLETIEEMEKVKANFTDGELAEVVQGVVGTFYIDTIDHPEYTPVLEKGEDFLSGLGEQVIPALLLCLEESDLKTDFHLASVLGKMGGVAVAPLLKTYRESGHEISRIFSLYAIGKIRDPKALEAVPTLLEALGEENVEFRDTATRALGKVCENVEGSLIPGESRTEIFKNLMKMVGDTFAGVRSKAFRSLGKMARYNLLDQGQRDLLSTAIKRALGETEEQNWDVAYIVRMEAKKARVHLK